MIRNRYTSDFSSLKGVKQSFNSIKRRSVGLEQKSQHFNISKAEFEVHTKYKNTKNGFTRNATISKPIKFFDQKFIQ